MAERSAISWTDATWNPVAGCSLKSPGCTSCYAMAMARRHELMSTAQGRVSPYAGLTRIVNGHPVWTGELRLVEDALTLPLRWRKPRRIFVNSMSDLFHEAVPDAWIDRVFAVMALAPQHTFQVLTKRSARMRAYLSAARAHPVGMAALDQVFRSLHEDPRSTVGAGVILQGDIAHLKAWPLPNVWLGVSAEDQRRADERVPDLLATPAAVRFVSAEPLLGPVDFRRWLLIDWQCSYCREFFTGRHKPFCPACGKEGGLSGSHAFNGRHQPKRGGWPIDRGSGLDLIIVGGESGRGARPMHPQWARDIRDQCAAAGVAFHFKQWGEHLPVPVINEPHFSGGRAYQHPSGGWIAAGVREQRGPTMRGASFRPLRPGDLTGAGMLLDADWMAVRVGKKAAGRLLDGVEHNEWPGSVR